MINGTVPSCISDEPAGAGPGWDRVIVGPRKRERERERESREREREGVR